MTNQYGAHGVIREGDLGAKRAEFQAWAIETQNVDIEALGKVCVFSILRTAEHQALMVRVGRC